MSESTEVVAQIEVNEGAAVELHKCNEDY